MLRPTRSRLVTEIRYRPCTPPVQPDQNPIIFCIISRHFRACILQGNHRRANAWAGARVAAATPHSAAMLPATAAALIGTIKGIARCCGIRRGLGRSQTNSAPRRKRAPRVFAAPQIQSAATDSSLGQGPAVQRFWHFNCLVRSGRWWPGTLVVTDRLRFPTLRIVNL